MHFRLQEKLQEQDRVASGNAPANVADLGKLYCRAYYHLKEETLYVESKNFFDLLSVLSSSIVVVISCKNLKPCDSNGLR